MWSTVLIDALNDRQKGGQGQFEILVLGLAYKPNVDDERANHPVIS
jgi:UDP-N-acetyl-D-mannosaminuronate dehydrogenase